MSGTDPADRWSFSEITARLPGFADSRILQYFSARKVAFEGKPGHALGMLSRISLRGMQFAPEARCLMIRCAIEDGEEEWALSLCHSFQMWLRDSERRRSEIVGPWLAFVRACSGLIRQPGAQRLNSICSEREIRERGWLIERCRIREFP